MRLTTSLCMFAALATMPSAVSAATTITNTGGVEVIVAQPDAPVATTNRQHASKSRAALAGASLLVRETLALLGTPYLWGGTSPRGFDCSGFTYYAFARLGIRIPRSADAQFAAGNPVNGDPLPGDLVFFQTYDYGASHVGIYLGNGEFVNAIGPNVHIASFASTYFRSRYIGARRFLPT